MPDSGMNPGGMNQNSGTAPGGMTPDNYMFPGIGTAPGGGMPPGGMMPDDNMFPGGRVPNDYLFPGAMMPDGGITPGGMGQNGGMTDGNMLPYGAPPQPGGMPGQPNYPMPDFAPPPADMPPPPGMDMNGAVQTMSAGGDVPCLSDSARFPEYSYRPARSEPAGGKTSGYVPTMDAGPGGFGQNAAGQESAEYYKTVASLGASDFERAMANPHVQDYIQTMSELGRTGHAYPLDGEFAEDGEYVETIGGIGHGNIPGRGSCFTKNSAGFAGELRRYIDDEINDHRYFQALSGRAPNRSIARDLSEIARDELRNARAFSSALYMITGEQYMPRFSGRMRVPGSFPQAVRAGFLAETRDGERYMSAAKRARDNCLRDLLQTTATAEFRHARQLREILESTMPAPGRR